MNPRRLLGAFGALWLAASANAAVMSPRADTVDTASLDLLTKGADAQVQSVIDIKASALRGEPRPLTRQVRRLVTPFVWSQSTYHHDESLIPHIEEMLAMLVQRQHDDGTFSGGNRHSPPDTGFLIEDFGIMETILSRDQHPASTRMAETIRLILTKAGPGMAKGGVHTPNHRWKICSALARIYKVTGEESYVDRIDEWLAEGIDQDADGIYSERSPIYYGAVSNPSLLAVAHILNRTDLISYVRKNLELNIQHSEPNSEPEVVHSRRQDQSQAKRDLQDFYVQYRELALLDNNGRFAAMANVIEKVGGLNLGDFLADVVERQELMQQLPAEEQPFVDFEKLYSGAGLVRARRGKLTTTVFGGTDWYSNGEETEFFNRIGSGLSTNPTLFRAWNGGLVLEGVRVVSDFFSMGHFRSNGISFADGVSKLGNELKIPYYLPIAPELRDQNGTYKMSRSVDGRFYSALDFGNRPTSTRDLKTDITISPTDTGYDLVFDVTGEADVGVTIEVTFRPGGTLEGAEELVDENGVTTYHLVEGQGKYSLGNDTITFGPGNGDGVIDTSAGEQYSWPGGNLVLTGHRVFITGTSPMKYTLKLGFA
ncbi:hypothetical protein MCOR25_003810 [Pyricularia grisea]|nr:hypothetical protein MCOR25_003810 [Pyricularia grisea]